MNWISGTQDLIDGLRRYFAPEPPNPGQGFRSQMTAVMPVCPVCGEAIVGHQYQELASLPYKEGNDEKLKAMDEAYQRNRWDVLSRFQEFEGARDNAVVFLFRCPDRRHNLTVFYDPLELYDWGTLLRHKEVKAGELPASLKEWKLV